MYLLVGLVAFSASSGLFYASNARLTKYKAKGTRKEFCVAHSTNNPWAWGTAKNNAEFLTRNRHAGGHKVVDDQEMWQTADYSWSVSAVGGKPWRGFKPKPWLKNRVKNNNSISWEMCLGWDRDNTAIVERTCADIGYVLVTQGLEIGAVVRHHDAVGKYCPFFGQLYMTDREWLEFYKNPSRSGYWSQGDEDGMFYKFKLRCEYWRLYHLYRLGKIDQVQYDRALNADPMLKWVCDRYRNLKPWQWPEYPVKGIERNIRQITPAIK